jgi:hypothetical protein
MKDTAVLEQAPIQTTLSQLDQLRKFSKIVADTGDFGVFKDFSPQDATTNPSLIFKAAQKPEYQPLLERAIAEQKEAAQSKEAMVSKIADDLLVLFGVEILKIVPGRVSTETDASLSFDTAGLHLPTFAAPDGRTPADYFEQMAREGLEKRLASAQRDPSIPPEKYRERLEYEIAEYFQDLVSANRAKALILLGNEGSEEPGSGEVAAWVKTFVTEVPVEWTPAGEPFWAVS